MIGQKYFCRAATVGIFSLALAAAWAGAAPRALTATHAAGGLGGTISPACSGDVVNSCLEQGCSYRSQCTGTVGDFLCEDRLQCTRAGCTTVQGTLCR